MKLQDLQDFVKLFLVLHDQDVGLTVGSHILTSFSGVGGVNSSRQTSVAQIRNRRIKKIIYFIYSELKIKN